MTNGSMPTKEQLHNPVLRALKASGGSATNVELFDFIVETLKLSDTVVDQRSHTGQSVLWSRISWARNELKHAGYVEQTGTGIWAVTALGAGTTTVDSRLVRREAVRVVQGQASNQGSPIEPEASEEDSVDDNDSWRGEMGQILHKMPPDAFERLCGVILRESGFTEVNVTGKSGDGGIDGNGILLVQGIISIPVAFQSKRYQGSVGAPEVQKLRGSLNRPGERGLLITTGSFTSQARRAAREGSSVIDLIDGESLLDRLKELELGVKVEKVEQVTIEADWWESNYGASIRDEASGDEE